MSVFLNAPLSLSIFVGSLNRTNRISQRNPFVNTFFSILQKKFFQSPKTLENAGFFAKKNFSKERKNGKIVRNFSH
jgi:hypothetical protein